MPATERGLRDRDERNRIIYETLKRYHGRSIWRQLVSITGLTRPRLSRGLRELEQFGVIKAGWIPGSRIKWVYQLTGEPLPRISKVSRSKGVHKDFTTMKEPQWEVHWGRTRHRAWKSS